ncbi:MAG: Ig-like domain-containing protein [bacterium]|nr:Ig-like domain-containing protein [bacterium]
MHIFSSRKIYTKVVSFLVTLLFLIESTLLPIITLLPRAASAATTTFTASADFSTSTQGQKNWWYLSSSGAQMTYDSANSRWKGNEEYLLLGSNWGHPGNNADALRRWIAPQAGSIRITGNARDSHAGCGTDGVTVTIRKVVNNAIVATLWNQTIPKDNTTGYNFDVTTSVSQGDSIDFVINKGIDNGCDSTVFDPTIVLTASAAGSWGVSIDSGKAGTFPNPVVRGKPVDFLATLTVTDPPSPLNFKLEVSKDLVLRHYYITRTGGQETALNDPSRPAATLANRTAYVWDFYNLTTGVYTLRFNFDVPLTTTETSAQFDIFMAGLHSGYGSGYQDQSFPVPALTFPSGASVSQGTPLIVAIANATGNTTVYVNCIVPTGAVCADNLAEGITNASGQWSKSYDTSGWTLGTYRAWVSVGGLKSNLGFFTITQPSTLPSTIQGYKIDSSGAVFSSPGATITVAGSSFSQSYGPTTNPYFAQQIPAGNYTVTSSVPTSYTVSYSLCYNCANNTDPHPASSYVSGPSVSVSAPADGYADVWWKYTLQTSGQSVSISRTPATSQTNPYRTGSATTFNATVSPSLFSTDQQVKVYRKIGNGSPFVSDTSTTFALRDNGVCNPSAGTCSIAGTWSEFTCPTGVSGVQQMTEWVTIGSVTSNQIQWWFECTTAASQPVTILQSWPTTPSAQPGQSFSLTYNWSGGPTSSSKQVFVHFVNSAGQIAFQDDHTPPVLTNQWSGAKNYTRTVTVPASTAVGTYRIMAGLYDLATGARLTLTPGSGVIADTQDLLRYQIGTLTVSSSPSAQFEIRPASASLSVGQTQTLAAWFMPAGGSASDVTSQTQWSSSNAAVAELGAPPGSNANNTVLGRAAGSAVITATYQGQTAQAMVTVGTSGTQLVVSKIDFSDLLLSGRRDLLRFKIAAPSGSDVGIAKFTIRNSITSASSGSLIDNLNIYAYTDSSFSTVASGVQADGSLQVSHARTGGISGAEVDVYAQNTGGSNTLVNIPAGQTRWFVVRGDVTIAGTSVSSVSALSGDASGAGSGTFSSVNSAANNNFIWASNSAGKSLSTITNFQNGYGINGLPVSGLSQTLTGGGVVTPSTIQGYKIDSSGAVFSSPGATITVTGSSFNQSYGPITNPYFAQQIPAGNYTVTSSVPTGYTVSYSLCYNCANNADPHPASSYVADSSVSVNAPAGGYADVWWKYTLQTSGQSIVISRTPQTSTVSPFKAGDTTTFAMTIPSSLFLDTTAVTLHSQMTGGADQQSNYTVASLKSANVCNTSGSCSVTGVWNASQFTCPAGVSGTAQMKEWVTVGNTTSNQIQWYFQCEGDAIEGVLFEIRPASASLSVGQTQTLAAWFTPAGGSASDVTNQTQWSSSNPAVAELGAPPGGAVNNIVLGRANGAATITATYQGQTAQATVTVGSEVAAFALDLKVNNADGPVSVQVNTPATVSWTTQGFSAGGMRCSTSGAPTGSPFHTASGVSGSVQVTFPQTQSYTLQMTCFDDLRVTANGSIPSASDSVTVNVAAVPSGLSAPTPETAPMDVLRLQSDQDVVTTTGFCYNFTCTGLIPVTAGSVYTFSANLNAGLVGFPQDSLLWITLPPQATLFGIILDSRTLTSGTDYVLDRGHYKLSMSQLGLLSGTHSIKVALQSDPLALDHLAVLKMNITDGGLTKTFIRERTASVSVRHAVTEVIGKTNISIPGASPYPPYFPTIQESDVHRLQTYPAPAQICDASAGTGIKCRPPSLREASGPVSRGVPTIAYTLLGDVVPIYVNQFSDSLSREFIIANYNFLLGRNPTDAEMQKYLSLFTQWRDPVNELIDVYKRRVDVQEAMKAATPFPCGNLGDCIIPLTLADTSRTPLYNWAYSFGANEEPTLKAFKENVSQQALDVLRQVWNDYNSKLEAAYKLYQQNTNSICFSCTPPPPPLCARVFAEPYIVNGLYNYKSYFDSCRQQAILWAKNAGWASAVRLGASSFSFDSSIPTIGQTLAPYFAPGVYPEYQADRENRYPPATLYYEIVSSPEYLQFVQAHFKKNIDALYRFIRARAANDSDINEQYQFMRNVQVELTQPCGSLCTPTVILKNGWIRDNWEPQGYAVSKDGKGALHSLYGIRNIAGEISAMSGRLIHRIADSSEMRSGNNFKRVLTGLFRLYVRRDPRQDEVEYWQNRMNTDNAHYRLKVAEGLLSDSYQDFYGFEGIEIALNQSEEYGRSGGSADAVNNIYRTYFGVDRTASDVGLGGTLNVWFHFIQGRNSDNLTLAQKQGLYAEKHPELKFLFPLERIEPKPISNFVWVTLGLAVLSFGLNLAVTLPTLLTATLFGGTIGYATDFLVFTIAQSVSPLITGTISVLRTALDLQDSANLSGSSVMKGISSLAGGAFSVSAILDVADEDLIRVFGQSSAQSGISSDANMAGNFSGSENMNEKVSGFSASLLDAVGFLSGGEKKKVSQAPATQNILYKYQEQAAATTTTAVIKPLFTRTLRLGSRGEDVRKLQEILSVLYPSFLSQYQTSYFGLKTFEGVKKLQKQYGLSQVGAVGPQTKALLNRLSGN